MDDGAASGDSASPTETDDEPFSTPALKELCVDGRNFAYACLAIPSWIESLRGPDFQLQIHNFIPSQSIPRDLEFTLHDFIRVLSKLRLSVLCLSNVEFCHESLPTTMPDVILRVDAFEFKTLSHGFFCDMLAWSRNGFVEAVHISQCPIGSVTFEFTSDYLVLSGIDEQEDIGIFLRLWHGIELWVESCPSFDDSALKGIGEADEQLAFLEIENCSSFSPQGLQNAIQRLNADAENDDVVIGHKAIALSHLSVRGHKHTLTPEEDRWFQRNTSSFTWIPVNDDLTDGGDRTDERVAGC